MEFKNSYIFLKREKEKKQVQKNKKENVIVVNLPPSFKKLLQTSFQDISFSEKEDDLDFINAGSFTIDYKNIKTEVLFKYHNVWSNYYLDIIVKQQKKQDAVNILNIVNNKLVANGNVFDKDFISIISYDCISEYYCNKLFPYLNKFERKLRKILFIVYTLNFNLKYYSSTTSEEFQSTLEQKSKIQKAENISRKDCKIKLGFYSLDYHDIETLLFSKSITIQEKQKLQNFLENNHDLTKLSDSEIRKAFDLCTYKSDWERFFGNKEFNENFQIVFNDIRIFRNNIAHCKFISTSQYEKCLEILKTTNKSLDKAIEITENQDFINRNIELQHESFQRFAKTIRETFLNLYKPFFDDTNLLTEPLRELSTKMNEIVKPITEMLPKISDMVPKVELPKIDLPNTVLPEMELSKFNMVNYFSDNNKKEQKN